MEKARKNSISGGPLPRRKMILQTGTLNFRPPVSRSKSAPRLGSIDEEDEVDEDPMTYHEEYYIEEVGHASESGNVFQWSRDGNFNGFDLRKLARPCSENN